jgi:hypothetical protein
VKSPKRPVKGLKTVFLSLLEAFKTKAGKMDKLSFLPPESGFRKAAASMTALIRLRERHGIVK